MIAIAKPAAIRIDFSVKLESYRDKHDTQFLLLMFPVLARSATIDLGEMINSECRAQIPSSKWT